MVKGLKYTGSKIYRSDIETALHGIDGIEEIFGSSVVITGATGMIGSFLADMILYLNRKSDAGIRLYAAGRSQDKVIERFGEDTDIMFLDFDMMHPSEPMADSDYVIHAAGYSDPASFNTDPVGTVTGNISGTGALLEYARNHGCKRFLYVSSGEVYGQGNPDAGSFKETYSGYVNPMSVRSCYPVSKRAAETLCVSFESQYGLDVVIVRPSHVYGATFQKEDSHAYVQFLKKALTGKDIEMKSPGDQTRSYTYVADCATAMLTALIKGGKGQAYNIANPDSVVNIRELAGAVAEVSGVEVIYCEPDETDVRDRSPIARQVLDPSKLMALGFTPQYNISKGILHTYQILKEAGPY